MTKVKMFVNNSTCLRDLAHVPDFAKSIYKFPDTTYEGTMKDNNKLVIGQIEIPENYSSVEDFLAKAEFNVKFEVPNTSKGGSTNYVDEWYYCFITWFSCLGWINDYYLYEVEVTYATSFSPTITELQKYGGNGICN